MTESLMSPHSTGTSSPIPASLPRRSFKLHLLPLHPLPPLPLAGDPVVRMVVVLAPDFLDPPSPAAMGASLVFLLPSAAVAVLEFAAMEPVAVAPLVGPRIVPLAPSAVAGSWDGENKLPPVTKLERSGEQFG